MVEFLNKILNGESLEILKKIPSESIDCCVTSPPYWGLRDYGVDNQLGIEDDFNQYIDRLILIFNEIYRVLKPTGVCFVNLGDIYNTVFGRAVQLSKGKTPLETMYSGKKNLKVKEALGGLTKMSKSCPRKSLIMIPERFAIRMIDNGWVLRNQIIWHKPNQMPQSAKDRFTVDFEKIFFFTKQSKGYYFKQQLEPYEKPLDRWGGDEIIPNGKSTWDDGTGQSSYRKRNLRPNPEGRNMRTVWSINTKPFKDAHFATFPEELVNRMILAGCPENGIVIDPFIGSGTTAVVARKLNRNYVGIELNPKYIEIANKRLYNELGLFS